MAAAPKVRIIKYFGSATIQQMELDLAEAKAHLEYFWTKDGGNNITLSVDGQALKSYDDLLAIAAQDCYKNRAYIDVGLFLSNEGKKSIWPK